MARSIRARYEKGALRLLEPVGLAEGAAVEITIVPERWNERLQSLLVRVRGRARELPPGEIEAEISRAADEVRAERLADHEPIPAKRSFLQTASALQIQGPTDWSENLEE